MLYYNEPFFFIDATGQEAFCHLQIYKKKGACGSERHVVIATEMADNTGQSVTNGAAVLATRISGVFEIPPSEMVFFEHYDASSYHNDPDKEEAFAQTTFRWEGRNASMPDWKHADKDKIQKLIS